MFKHRSWPGGISLALLAVVMGAVVLLVGNTLMTARHQLGRRSHDVARTAVNTHKSGTADRLPAKLLPVLARTLNRDLPAAWQARELPRQGAQLFNPAQRLTLQTVNGGTRLTLPGGSTLGIRLTEIVSGGRGRRLHVEPAVARGARIEIRHGHGLREWFANSPLGIEQGFTLEHPPVASQNSTELRFKLTGSLTPVLHGGTLRFENHVHHALLSYGSLVAYDAHHRRLPAHMSLEGVTLSLQVDTRNAVYPVVIDPLFSATNLLTEPTPQASDQFGYAVAISRDGTVALIGVPGANKAYVFTYAAAAKQWAATAMLSDPGSNTSDNFGSAVALSADGTQALVGAPGAGKAYLFSSGAWNTAAHVFDDPQGAAADNFGGSVALSHDGSVALIGAKNATAYTPAASTKAPSISAGRAYAYASASWSDPAVFQEPTPAANAWFGFSVALASGAGGDTALIGAPQATVFVPSSTSASAPPTAVTFAGTAYVYKFSYSQSKGWSSGASSPIASLAEPVPAGNDQFGYAVSLSSDGSAGLVGAPYAGVIPQGTTYTMAAAGKVYLYSGGGWSSPIEFDNPDTIGASAGVSAENADFGFSVALAADNSGAVIGAPGATIQVRLGSSSTPPASVMDAGKVFAYSQTRGSWLPQSASLAPPQAFLDPGTSANDHFGSSVASAALGSASVPVVDGLAGGPQLGVKPGGATTVMTAGSVLAIYTSDDVSLALNAPAGPVSPGSTITYDFTVTNNDSSITATNLVLTDTLPGSVSNITTSGGSGSCSNTSGTVTCTLASLAPQGIWQPSITVKAPAARTTVTNSAAVNADQADTDESNNSTTVSTAVAQQPAATGGTLTAWVSGSGTLTGTVGVGEIPTYSLVTQAAHGTVTVNSNGSYTYTANQNYLNTLSAVCGGSAGSSGTDSFQFKVGDGTYTSAPAAVTVTVYPGPTACPSSYTNPGAHGTTPVTGQQLTGLDPDPAKALTYGVTTQPSHGSVTVSSSGAYTYTPANYTGPDSFTFSVSDAHGNLSTAAVSVQDYAAPTVSNGAFTLHGTTSSTKLELTGTEPDPTQIPTINFTQPGHGTIALGTVSVNTGTFTVSFTYTSTDPGYTGTDSFSFTATDAFNTSNTGTVTLTVYTPPVANSSTLIAHVTASGAVAATDSDPTQPLVYTVTASPTHGKLTTFNPVTGAYTYQADAGYSGPDSFQFTAKDSYATSNTATLSITDFAAPVASNGSLTVHTAASGNLQATDPDTTQTLTYSIVNQPEHGAVTLNAQTGAYIYRSDTGYTGPDSFSFSASDAYNSSNTATVSIANYAAPTASGGSLTVHGGAAGTVAASDPDSSQTLNYSVVRPPAHGSIQLNAATGAYTYTASPGYTGTDSFTFNAVDSSHVTSNTAQVTLTVYAVPAAADATLVVHGSGSGKLLATEPDPQQTLSYAIVSAPAHGKVSLDAATGSYTYTANPGSTGSDSFTFVAKDSYNTSNVATVKVTAYGPPTAVAGTLAASENQPAQGQLRASDPDATQQLAYVVVSLPAHGALSLGGASGAFVYTPATGYVGNDSFSYAAKDAYATSNTASVDITVAANSSSGGSSGTPQASGPPAAVAPGGGGTLGWIGLLLLSGLAGLRRRRVR